MWAVTDNSNHCMSIFDRAHQLIRKFGSYGTGIGQFNWPLGITFDANNHVYVTDHNNHRIQKFDNSFEFMIKFGTYESDNGQLKHPIGITVHDNKVFITEWQGNRISVFQLDGQFSYIIGSGRFSSPHYITVSSNDQFLVANYGHHCISIFTLYGNYVGKFGTQGTGRGQLSTPSGIATDMYGFIFVTELDNSRVSIFDKDGNFICSFGSNGSGLGKFSYPHQIPYSGKFSEGKVFGNLPFTNTSEINFRKLSVISNL